jgi:chaperone BCS1
LNIAKKLIDESRDHALPKDGKIEIRNSAKGYWCLSSRIRPRSIDSVVLDGDMANVILNDIKKFQKSSNWYTKLGVPYRRGYLLYGPAGCGKTSFVLSIASELGMNVSVLSLSSPGMNDGKILELLSDADVNTIVLIEDIDCAFVKRKPGSDRKDKFDFGLTFSGVLNALDGIMSQDGRIIFMTTNYIDRLDTALIRPGRADVKVYIGNASKEQAYRLFCRFYPGVSDKIAKSFVESIPDYKISMAKIQHHLMLYRDQPEEACKNTQGLIKAESYEQAI